MLTSLLSPTDFFLVSQTDAPGAANRAGLASQGARSSPRSSGSACFSRLSATQVIAAAGLVICGLTSHSSRTRFAASSRMTRSSTRLALPGSPAAGRLNSSVRPLRDFRFSKQLSCGRHCSLLPVLSSLFSGGARNSSRPQRTACDSQAKPFPAASSDRAQIRRLSAANALRFAVW